MTQPEIFRRVTVARDANGYWTHPDYFTPADDREYGMPGEFQAWLKDHNLDYAMSWMENGAIGAVKTAYEQGEDNISGWIPVKPAGDGWFIGSIHDTEDGPVCIWLKELPCAAR